MTSKQTILDLGMKIRAPYNHDLRLIERVLDYRDYVDSMYFAPNNAIFPASGAILWSTTKWDKYDDELKKAIRTLNDNKIKPYLLLNATNFDPEIVKNYERSRLRRYLKTLADEGLQNLVIFNLPLGQKIKKDIPEMKFEVSITAGVDNAAKAQYWAENLDIEGICVHQRINKRPDILKKIKERTGKRLAAIVNRSCIINCPNEVSHQNFTTYPGHSVTYFNCNALLFENPWDAFHQGKIVPANLKNIKGILDIAKLEGRSGPTEDIINQIIHYATRLDSFEYKYDGDVKARPLSLPFYHPYQINQEPPEVFAQVSKCELDCENCGFCRRQWKESYGFGAEVVECVEGYRLYNRGEYGQAAEKFKKYLETGKQGRGEANYYLGMSLEHIGKYEDAVKCLEAAVNDEYGRKRYNVYFPLAVGYSNIGRHTDALRNYLKAKELAPAAEPTDSFNINIGITYQRLNEHEKAIEYLKPLENSDGIEAERGTILMNLGMCYQALNDHHEAIKDYEKAYPYVSAGTAGEKGMLRFQQGLCHIAVKDYTSARKCFEEALLGGDNLARAHFNLGVSSQGLNEFDDALKHYEEAYRLTGDKEKEDRAAILYQQALCRIGLKDYHGAEECLKAAAAAGAAGAEISFNLGICLHELKDYASARKAYEDALDSIKAGLSGANLEKEVRFHKGISAIEGGDAVSGVKELEAVMKLGADDKDLRFNLGLGYENIGRYADAEKEYIAALARAEAAGISGKEVGTVHLHLGICKLELGDPVGAKNEVRESIKGNPEALGNYNMLGSICRQMREYDEAIEAVSDGLRLGKGTNPVRSTSYRLLGVLKREKGDMAGAEECLNAAIFQDAAEWSNYNVLGNIYREQGREKESQKMYAEALTRAPEDYKGKIREKMKKG
jgi:tetratricopeptide (TPR) repeat protein